MSDPDIYLKKAKACVLKLYERETLKEENKLKSEDLYIVWFVKALGNWKALISTDKWPGQYWEITHNGAKNESYVDGYTKDFNKCIPDSEL